MIVVEEMLRPMLLTHLELPPRTRVDYGESGVTGKGYGGAPSG